MGTTSPSVLHQREGVGASLPRPRIARGQSLTSYARVRQMSDGTIEAAQSIIGEDMEFERLDQIYDLQRLIGPVIAYKILLEIAINSADSKEKRMAASKLIDAVNEEPERVAERLRASVFADLTLEQLQAVVQTGVTDPEEAVRRLKDAS